MMHAGKMDRGKNPPKPPTRKGSLMHAASSSPKSPKEEPCARTKQPSFLRGTPPRSQFASSPTAPVFTPVRRAPVRRAPAPPVPPLRNVSASLSGSSLHSTEYDSTSESSDDECDSSSTTAVGDLQLMRAPRLGHEKFTRFVQGTTGQLQDPSTCLKSIPTLKSPSSRPHKLSLANSPSHMNPDAKYENVEIKKTPEATCSKTVSRNNDYMNVEIRSPEENPSKVEHNNSNYVNFDVDYLAERAQQSKKKQKPRFSVPAPRPKPKPKPSEKPFSSLPTYYRHRKLTELSDIHETPTADLPTDASCHEEHSAESLKVVTKCTPPTKQFRHSPTSPGDRKQFDNQVSVQIYNLPRACHKSRPATKQTEETKENETMNTKTLASIKADIKHRKCPTKRDTSYKPLHGKPILPLLDLDPRYVPRPGAPVQLMQEMQSITPEKISKLSSLYDKPTTQPSTSSVDISKLSHFYDEPKIRPDTSKDTSVDISVKSSKSTVPPASSKTSTTSNSSVVNQRSVPRTKSVAVSQRVGLNRPGRSLTNCTVLQRSVSTRSTFKPNSEMQGYKVNWKPGDKPARPAPPPPTVHHISDNDSEPIVSPYAEFAYDFCTPRTVVTKQHQQQGRSIQQSIPRATVSIYQQHNNGNNGSTPRAAVSKHQQQQSRSTQQPTQSKKESECDAYYVTVKSGVTVNWTDATVDAHNSTNGTTHKEEEGYTSLTRTSLNNKGSYCDINLKNKPTLVQSPGWKNITVNGRSPQNGTVDVKTKSSLEETDECYDDLADRKETVHAAHPKTLKKSFSEPGKDMVKHLEKALSQNGLKHCVPSHKESDSEDYADTVLPRTKTLPYDITNHNMRKTAEATPLPVTIGSLESTTSSHFEEDEDEDEDPYSYIVLDRLGLRPPISLPTTSTLHSSPSTAVTSPSQNNHTTEQNGTNGQVNYVNMTVLSEKPQHKCVDTSTRVSSTKTHSKLSGGNGYKVMEGELHSDHQPATYPYVNFTVLKST